MPEEIISVIAPLYNEEEVLPLFFKEMTRVADKMTEERKGLEFEIIFINDGSKDGSLNLLREFASTDKRVKYISFSRNFGKEAAMYAGLESSSGDYTVILDTDLQHPPEFIEKMYEYVSSGEYDCAATRRVSRKGEPKALSFFSRGFYKLINKISRIEIVDGAQDFRFMTRRMTDAVIEMKEYNRFSKGIFSWVGFNTKYIEYENIERAAGKTTWSFWKLFLYSLEGILAFSTVPLAAVSFLGGLFCVAAFIMIVATVIKTLIWGDPAAGYPTLICAIFLVGGVQLLCTGVLGSYLEKTYLETKSRPKYIIKETEETYKAKKKNEE